MCRAALGHESELDCGYPTRLVILIFIRILVISHERIKSGKSRAKIILKEPTGAMDFSSRRRKGGHLQRSQNRN